jgi:hypothetical protein
MKNMTQNKLSTDRRTFVKRGLAALSVIPLLHTITNPERVSAQALPTKPVDPTSAQAQALGYVHDATKADTQKFPKRAGAGGDKQFCNNCVLFQQGGIKLEGHDGDWGKCAIFIDGLVASNAWCNSWAPKPT